MLTLRSNRVIGSERRGTSLQSVARTASDSFRRKSLNTNSEIADMTEVRPRTAGAASRPTDRPTDQYRAVSYEVLKPEAQTDWAQCVATALGRVG